MLTEELCERLRKLNPFVSHPDSTPMRLIRPKSLSPLFAVLIFVAHLNCVVEHQLIGEISQADAILRVSTADTPSDGQLPAETETCDHGCICKGATLANSYVIPDSNIESFCFQFLALPSIDCLCGRSQPNPSLSAKTPVCNSLLRALDRCALLQTFLI